MATQSESWNSSNTLRHFAYLARLIAAFVLIAVSNSNGIQPRTAVFPEDNGSQAYLPMAALLCPLISLGIAAFTMWQIRVLLRLSMRTSLVLITLQYILFACLDVVPREQLFFLTVFSICGVFCLPFLDRASREEARFDLPSEIWVIVGSLFALTAGWLFAGMCSSLSLFSPGDDRCFQSGVLLVLLLFSAAGAFSTLIGKRQVGTCFGGIAALHYPFALILQLCFLHIRR